MGRTLLAGVLSLALIGCDGQRKQGIEERVLEGRPVSVAQNYGRCGGTISIVLSTDNYGKVLANYNGANGQAWQIDFTNAEALVRAQMAEGQSGRVTLRGKYRDNNSSNRVFQIKSIEAGGYNVDFMK